jgi:Fe-S oxidoreductase
VAFPHRCQIRAVNHGRILLIVLLAALVAVFFVTGLHQHMINLVMGLTAMPLRTFYWVSQLGMLPGTAVFVNAGSQIGRIDSLSGILSPGLLASLALLGIFPLAVRRGLGFVRKRHRPHPAAPNAAGMIPADSPLASRQQEIAEQCTECGACQKGCAFMAQYGTPKSIASGNDFSSSRSQAIAYECSLCGLCSAVCPEKLDPAALFLEVRRRCAEDGNLDESVYRAILGYEKKGYSPLFSWYGLPEGCDTIFFPGCALPGTRPAVTTDLYRRIREIIPSAGLVLDCCTKPSHDLGRTEHFQTLFGEMRDYLTGRGIRNVLTACPNCTKIFRQYGHGMAVRTVYDLLHAKSKVNGAPVRGATVTVHDPCPLRDDPSTQQAVRAMLTDMGYTVAEMKHRGKRTVCCGEGGTVGAVNRERAGQWAALRRRESGGRKIVTYCAGCTGFLNRVVPTVHVADLLCRPEPVANRSIKVARAPLTYWNRLRLKRYMKQEIRPKVQRTRPPDINAPSVSPRWKGIL